MTRIFVALFVAVAGAAVTVSAHHSYSAYELDRLVEVEGVIAEFEWRAPHSLLKVKADDGGLYIFEWRAPFGLQRAGIEQDTLKTGDRVFVTGNPHRGFNENRILNFKSVRRPADGWRWPNW
jgi:Family of unknown function (DUF6152)